MDQIDLINKNQEIARQYLHKNSDEAKYILLACDFLHYLFSFVPKVADQKKWIEKLDLREVKYLYGNDSFQSSKYFINSDARCQKLCEVIKQEYKNICS